MDAASTRDRREALARANRRLAVTRHLWRLCLEPQVIGLKGYEHGARLMLALGAQIGGWLRDLPAVLELLAAQFNQCSAITQDGDGILDGFRGDRLHAYWSGAPLLDAAPSTTASPTWPPAFGR